MKNINMASSRVTYIKPKYLLLPQCCYFFPKKKKTILKIVIHEISDVSPHETPGHKN